MPVTNIGAIEAVILRVHPSVPAHSVQELIALARKPGTGFSFGASGVGNVGYLVAEVFNARAGLQQRDPVCILAQRSNDDRSRRLGDGHRRRLVRVFTPAATPGEGVARLQAEIRSAFGNPQLRERFKELGLTPVGNTPADASLPS